MVRHEHDVEERRQAEEALHKAQVDLAHLTRVTTMGELAASIAHEMTNRSAQLSTTATSVCDSCPRRHLGMMKQFIDHHLNDFTAIVVQNDLMAFGVLRALQKSGIRVPQDVSAIGYDDMPNSGFSIPPLTTLRQDYEGIRKAAIYNLMSAIRKEQDRKPVLLKCPLIIRGSSGPVFRAKRKKPRTQPSLPDLSLKRL
jgi:hypothetical protein